MTMDQLRAGHAHFGKLAAPLGESGPIFALAARSDELLLAFDSCTTQGIPWRNASLPISHNVRS